jgi:membrane-associated protease RseP (regulator of RpoE activity)
MTEVYNRHFRRTAMRPTARTWAKHTVFFLVTFLTVTFAGVLPPFGVLPLPIGEGDPQNWNEVFQFRAALPGEYLALITGTVNALFTRPDVLIYGLEFSGSLLFILLCHEFGHYIACRIYGVDATLPFFIPTPPLLGPAGTLGAFIKIVSPMPSRKAVFDIGVAGPIAGFLALIPVAILGFLTWKTGPPLDPANELGIYFSDPPFFRILAAAFGIDLSLPVMPNPFYAASWLGLLVTALNLFPSGQLDGGHALFAVFGAKIHRWSSRLVFIVMSVLAVAGWFWYNSPSGFLFAILLGVMLRVGHPEPFDNSPLDFKRKLVAALTLLIFVLCFVPFPIQIK